MSDHAVRPPDGVVILESPPRPSIEALRCYWTTKCGTRAMPLRADIDPVEIGRHLPSLFMLDVIEGGRDFRYRLIGTEIVNASGRDVTGALFSQLYAGEPVALAKVVGLFAPAIAERRPVYARGPVFWHPERDYRRFEAGYFPVSTDGSAVDILLCEVSFL